MKNQTITGDDLFNRVGAIHEMVRDYLVKFPDSKVTIFSAAFRRAKLALSSVISFIDPIGVGKLKRNVNAYNFADKVFALPIGSADFSNLEGLVIVNDISQVPDEIKTSICS